MSDSEQSSGKGRNDTGMKQARFVVLFMGIHGTCICGVWKVFFLILFIYRIASTVARIVAL